MQRCLVYGCYSIVRLFNWVQNLLSAICFPKHIKDVDGDQTADKMDNSDSCNFPFHRILTIQSWCPKYSLMSWQVQSSSLCRVGFKSSAFWHFQGSQGAKHYLQLPLYKLFQETKGILRSTRLIVPALYGLCINMCILSDFMHMWRSAVLGMRGGWHAVAGRMGSTVVIGKLLMSWLSWLSTVHIM